MARLDTKVIDGVTVAEIQDSKLLENAAIEQIGKELLECVEDASNGRLLLDFNKVKFMSSAMMGRLVMLSTKCKKDKVTLKFCSLDKDIAEVFRITKLHKMFDIQKDQARGITAFTKKGWFD